MILIVKFYYFLLFSFRSSGSNPFFAFESAVPSIVLPRCFDTDAVRLSDLLALLSTDVFFRSRADFCVRGEKIASPVELLATVGAIVLLLL
jgi:hypothetical protein